MIDPAETNRFKPRYQVIPSHWEPHYCWLPQYSITGELLYKQDVYKRMRHTNNPQLGYEYATLLDILTLSSK